MNDRLTTCGDCGKTISKYAGNCPECGGVTDKKRTFLLIWGALVGLGFLFTCLWILDTFL
jgi:predicted amidophosphoribosyltransferase